MISTPCVVQVLMKTVVKIELLETYKGENITVHVEEFAKKRLQTQDSYTVEKCTQGWSLAGATLVIAFNKKTQTNTRKRYRHNDTNFKKKNPTTPKINSSGIYLSCYT